MSKLADKAKNSKKMKFKNNKSKKMGVYIGIVSVFLISMFAVYNYVNTYKTEIDVVAFTEQQTAGTLVEETNMEVDSVAQNNFEEGMVRWVDRENVIGKYTAHYIRAGVPTYEDMYVEEKPLETPYLYNLENDQELLTFPYSIAEAGGKLVRPGDRLRVRGSYQVKNGESEEVKSDVVFDVVHVQDLLNSNNESIVDILNDAARLPQADREALMDSADFMESITPRAVLMVVNSEEVNKYVQFEARETPQYTITLLSRNEELQNEELNMGSSVLQMLDEAQKNQEIVNE